MVIQGYNFIWTEWALEWTLLTFGQHLRIITRSSIHFIARVLNFSWILKFRSLSICTHLHLLHSLALDAGHSDLCVGLARHLGGVGRYRRACIVHSNVYAFGILMSLILWCVCAHVGQSTKLAKKMMQPEMTSYEVMRLINEKSAYANALIRLCSWWCITGLCFRSRRKMLLRVLLAARLPRGVCSCSRVWVCNA